MTEQQAQGADQQNGAQQGAQPPQGTPPWGDEANFDAERAWRKIQALEADKEKLKSRPTLDDDAKAKLAEYDQLKAASQTDLEKAQAELSRWQTEAERWRTTSVASTIKALAATDFEYPDDAVNALDAAKYLDAGGVIDEKAIGADLAALLENRPNWRRATGDTSSPRLPRPNAAQGQSNGQTPSDPAQQFAAILHNQLK